VSDHHNRGGRGLRETRSTLIKQLRSNYHFLNFNSGGLMTLL
jgi:hypothetical protein